jgi:hypothetical protein
VPQDPIVLDSDDDEDEDDEEDKGKSEGEEPTGARRPRAASSEDAADGPSKRPA